VQPSFSRQRGSILAWLASDETDYVTVQCFMIDDGMTAASVVVTRSPAEA
jgi:hypothetical protein